MTPLRSGWFCSLWLRSEDGHLVVRFSHCVGNIFPSPAFYVFGGHDGSSVLKTCERFNVTSQEWQPVKEMPVPRRLSTAVLLLHQRQQHENEDSGDGEDEEEEECVYVCGGDQGYSLSSDVQSSVLLYSPRHDRWRTPHFHNHSHSSSSVSTSSSFGASASPHDTMMMSNARCAHACVLCLNPDYGWSEGAIKLMKNGQCDRMGWSYTDMDRSAASHFSFERIASCCHNDVMWCLIKEARPAGISCPKPLLFFHVRLLPSVIRSLSPLCGHECLCPPVDFVLLSLDNLLVPWSFMRSFMSLRAVCLLCSLRSLSFVVDSLSLSVLLLVDDELDAYACLFHPMFPIWKRKLESSQPDRFTEDWRGAGNQVFSHHEQTVRVDLRTSHFFFSRIGSLPLFSSILSSLFFLFLFSSCQNPTNRKKRRKMCLGQVIHHR